MRSSKKVEGKPEEGKNRRKNVNGGRLDKDKLQIYPY